MKKGNTVKLFSLLLALVMLTGLIAITSGCTGEGSTVTVTQTPTGPAVTSPTSGADSVNDYPLATKETRFKIATTTSLYDTGLWYYLEPLFEEYANVELDIIYAGTGAALNHGRNGNVDAVVVHDPDQEKPFVDEGYGLYKRSFAYNFFMIAGPADDPAGIMGVEPAEALRKIAEAGELDPDNVKFVSRGDNSGTQGA
jgi:tungstate transport system substrate-binding protein